MQGVFFRVWTCQQAEALGISGWVRNCPDGSVEAHVEGDPDAVEQLIGQVSRGPPGARVDTVTPSETATENYRGFEVRH